jgi:hypothetical protein
MRPISARFAAAVLAGFLGLPTCGCTGLGLAVQQRLIAAPQFDIHLPSIHIAGFLSHRPDCPAALGCWPHSTDRPLQATYELWAFVDGTSSPMRVLALPLAQR